MAAPIAGTQTRYDTEGIREDLSDVIYNISPTDTPFMSMIGRGPKAKNTFTEWQTDSLAAVDTDNAHVEGSETDFEKPDTTTRVGNYTQIVKKSLILSGTLEAVDKAGRRSELAYQIAKRGKEIKRDVEAIMLANQAADAGSASQARRMGSLGAWVKTNVSKAADGANPVHTSGAPMQARTDGTPRDFVEDHVKEVVARMWEEGAEPKILMVGGYNKQRASEFEGVVQRSFDISNASPKPTAVIGAVDVIVTDFGTLRIIPNRWQRKRDAWVLDPEMADASYLRPFRTEKLAKTGDAEKRHLLAELTLRVKQEAGLGLIADLTTEDEDPNPGD